MAEIKYKLILSILLLFAIINPTSIYSQKFAAILMPADPLQNRSATFLNLTNNGKVFYVMPIISNPNYLSYSFCGNYFFKIEGFLNYQSGVMYSIGQFNIIPNGIELVENKICYVTYNALQQKSILKLADSTIKLLSIYNEKEIVMKEWHLDELIYKSGGISKICNDIDKLLNVAPNAKIDEFIHAISN